MSLHLVRGKYPDRLDEGIGQQVEGDALGILPAELGAVQQVLDGRIDRLVVGQRAPDDMADRVPRGAGHVIGHPGQKAHHDQPVEAVDDARLEGGLLDDGVGELAGDAADLVRLKIGADRVDVTGGHAGDREVKEVGDLPLNAVPAGIFPAGKRGDLDTIVHGCHVGLAGKSRRGPVTADPRVEHGKGEKR